MSDEALRKLEEIQKDVNVLKRGQEEIKEFIAIRDRVTLTEYCALRMFNGEPLKIRTLKGWLKKGCPREDHNHVSIKAVDNYMRTKHTKQPESYENK